MILECLMEAFHSTLFLEFCIHCILICTPALTPWVDPYRKLSTYVQQTFHRITLFKCIHESINIHGEGVQTYRDNHVVCVHVFHLATVKHTIVSTILTPL